MKKAVVSVVRFAKGLPGRQAGSRLNPMLMLLRPSSSAVARCELNRDNPAVRRAIPLKGCPPTVAGMIEGLDREGVECVCEEYVKYRRYLFDRYREQDGFDPGLCAVGHCRRREGSG